MAFMDGQKRWVRVGRKATMCRFKREDPCIYGLHAGGIPAPRGCLLRCPAGSRGITQKPGRGGDSYILQRQGGMTESSPIRGRGGTEGSHAVVIDKG